MKRRDAAPGRREVLNFEYELDAPPAKVWRALTIPEYVARWLAPPASDDRAKESAAPLQPPASLRLLDCEPNQSVRYLWRDAASPFVENTITFRVAANEAGGTTFRIVHEWNAAKRMPAANSNRSTLLLAA
jgi:uncharacterized protein YndB with AHSA1/START domain